MAIAPMYINNIKKAIEIKFKNIRKNDAQKKDNVSQNIEWIKLIDKIVSIIDKISMILINFK